MECVRHTAAQMGHYKANLLPPKPHEEISLLITLRRGRLVGSDVDLARPR